MINQDETHAHYAGEYPSRRLKRLKRGRALRPIKRITPVKAMDTDLVYDKRSVKTESVRCVDENGFMHVEISNISKAVVNPYYGKEIPNHDLLGLEPERVYWVLRPAEELEKAAATFNKLPLLDRHIPVGPIDLENPEVKRHLVGSTGEIAKFEHPYLTNSLVIWTEGAKEGVRSKSQTELSCAYRYEFVVSPGVFEGQPYDGYMTNIRGNHVALVTEGRAGHDVVVQDQGLVSEESVVARLVDIKKCINEHLKPCAEEKRRLVLDDCTGAIDVAIHHLLDSMEEKPTYEDVQMGVDKEPVREALDGCKRYTKEDKASIIKKTTTAAKKKMTR